MNDSELGTVVGDELLVAVEGSIAHLRLNRPAVRNALNTSLVKTLTAVLEECEEDPNIRVIVLSGEGPAFSSGADLGEVRSQDGREAAARGRAGAALHSRLWNLTTPVIAAVEGPAVAGGCGLALAADFVIAGSAAAFFSYPEVSRGLVPALIMPNLLALIGRRAAVDLLLTGRRVSAPEALEMGLITHCVPDLDVSNAVDGLCERLAGLDADPVKETMRLMNHIADMNFDDAMQQAELCSSRMRTSRAARSGSADFLDKEA